MISTDTRKGQRSTSSGTNTTRVKATFTKYSIFSNQIIHSFILSFMLLGTTPLQSGTLVCHPSPNAQNPSVQHLQVTASNEWTPLNVQGVQLHAKIQTDGSLKLRKQTTCSNNKVERYHDRMNDLQHELSHRVADVAGIDAELQQLLAELETPSDDNHDTFSEIAARTQAKGLQKERVRTIRQLDKLHVRYQKTTRSETVVVRDNRVTGLKWSASEVLWVTKEAEEAEIESEEEVVEEAGVFPVCFSEDAKKLCVVGGYGQAGYLKSMECYDVDANTWSVMRTEFREHRSSMATCVLDGNMYVIGGVFGGTKHDVDRYSIKDGVWSRIEDMNQARCAHCAVVLGGCVYALGGSNGDALATVERFDVSENTWTNVAPMRTARAYFGACVLNGCIYVFGGWDGSHTSLSSVERYDPDTDTWREVTAMNRRRGRVSGAVLGGYIYACGGIDENDACLGSVERYDHEKNTWVEVAPMLVARVDHRVIAVGSHLYSIGGVDSNSHSLSSVERYDAVHDRWESMASMNGPRRSMGAY